jgi:hypothetical protein
MRPDKNWMAETREVTRTVPKGSLWTRGISMAEAEMERNWTPIGRWSRASEAPEAPDEDGRGFTITGSAGNRSAHIAGSSGAAREGGQRYIEEPALQGMAA